MTQGNIGKKVKEECRQETCKDFRGGRRDHCGSLYPERNGAEVGLWGDGSGERGILGNIGQHCRGGEIPPLLLHSCVKARQERSHQGQG